MSSKEKTEKVLKVLLIDYDNCKDVEENEENDYHLPKLRIWKVLITSDDYWKKLIELEYDNNQAKTYFETLNNEQRRPYFTFGVACLLSFVQANFTGPDFQKFIEDYLTSEMFKDIDFAKLLSLNNEDINVNTKFPCLLVAAKLIFQNCKLCPLLNLWWLWRVLIIHQQVMDELSPALLSVADQLQKEIQSISLDDISGHSRAKFEIEQAQLYLMYRNVAKAEVHIDLACDILGLKYQLVGKLGKRTKYQEEDIPQLALEISLLEQEGIERPTVNICNVAQNIELDDNIRLDKIKYVTSGEVTQLPNTEQKLILTIIQKMLISKPQDELYYEEIKPFIDLLLMQNNTWPVRIATLLLRSRLEAKHNRTIERSMLQIGEILNCIKKEDPHPLTRMGGVYGANLQPIWKTEAQQADVMLNLGLVKASLDVYFKLQLWEEVIVCYTILNMRHKSAEIIKQQLEVNPTVKLWCLLGDATDDPTCYEKAWEMSKRRSHRAQRHWGQFLFSRKQYQQCIPHFEKSVSINPLQSVVWLRLGYAALETENWQCAATAYRRYTTLEPDGFEAWNNLAQAYIKLGNKRSAHQALLDALRCNFDNWKVWENFLVVSAEISHFSDVIRAYHRLLDLKEKYLNTDVLGVLVYGVCSNVNDSEGRPSSNLMQKTRELIGRVTSLYPGEGLVWVLYASLAPILLLRAQRLQRAYRGYTQSNWDKNPIRCQQVLYVCQKLAEVALNDQIEPKDTLVNSVRLNLSSAISAIKKHDYKDTKALLQEVTALLAKLIEKAKSHLVCKTGDAPKAT
ncbi:hypothetical protein Trydic_g2878 [Trypoxylus dichotomus]